MKRILIYRRDDFKITKEADENMNFDGTFEVKANKNTVFTTIMNPEEISGCIPGFKSLNVVSPEEYSVVVRVGLAFIKGDFNIKFKVVESEENSHAKLSGTGMGMGGTLDLHATIDLTEEGEMTKMDWNAEAKVGGKLGAMGQRIIGGQAQKIIKEMFACLEKKFSSS